MKLFQRFVRLLFRIGTKTKAQEQPARANSGGPSPQKATPEHSCAAVSNDDSPPGYKVRWHH